MLYHILYSFFICYIIISYKWTYLYTILLVQNGVVALESRKKSWIIYFSSILCLEIRPRYSQVYPSLQMRTCFFSCFLKWQNSTWLLIHQVHFKESSAMSSWNMHCSQIGLLTEGSLLLLPYVAITVKLMTHSDKVNSPL